MRLSRENDPSVWTAKDPAGPYDAWSMAQHEHLSEIVSSVERVIAGQRDAVTLLLAALLSGGHVLLEDRPGVGKTVLARALATTLGLDSSRIQGTPDLLPTDITGIHVFNPADASWPFRAGPIFASLVLVDEFNRATPKAQSALLEAMAENQVTVDGTTAKLPQPFMVIATQNPPGGGGTHPLVAAQLDRFSLMTKLGLPGRESERAILSGSAGFAHLSGLKAVLTRAELIELMLHVRNLPMAPSIVEYILDIVDSVRRVDGDVWLSVRASASLADVARGHAVISGRNYVAPEDVQAAAPHVLIHRLPRQFDESVIRGIIRSVEVPVASR